MGSVRESADAFEPKAAPAAPAVAAVPGTPAAPALPAVPGTLQGLEIMWMQGRPFQLLTESSSLHRRHSRRLLPRQLPQKGTEMRLWMLMHRVLQRE